MSVGLFPCGSTTDTPAFVSDGSPTTETERDRMRSAIGKGVDY